MNSVVPQGTHPAAERALQPERRVRWHHWQRHNSARRPGRHKAVASGAALLQVAICGGLSGHGAAGTRGRVPTVTVTRPGLESWCGTSGTRTVRTPGRGPGLPSGVRNRPPTTAGKRPSVTPVSQRRMFGARFPRWAAVFRPEAAPRLQSHLVLLPPRFSPRGPGGV